MFTVAFLVIAKSWLSFYKSQIYLNWEHDKVWSTIQWMILVLSDKNEQTSYTQNDKYES